MLLSLMYPLQVDVAKICGSSWQLLLHCVYHKSLVIMITLLVTIAKFLMVNILEKGKVNLCVCFKNILLQLSIIQADGLTSKSGENSARNGMEMIKCSKMCFCQGDLLC